VTFRLLNILSFFDRFAEGFSQLGNVASHSELDMGKSTNNQLFWEGVQEAFQGQDPTIDNLHFADDEVLQKLHYINFTKIVQCNVRELGLALETVSNPLLKCDMESDLVVMTNKKIS